MIILRGAYSEFHDYFVRQNPNAWTATMRLVVDTLMLIIFVGFPIRMMDWTPGGDTTCFQMWVIVSVFLLQFAFRIPTTMVRLLSDPIHASALKIDHDIFDCDALIAAAERKIFCMLRGTFDKKLRNANFVGNNIGRYLKDYRTRKHLTAVRTAVAVQRGFRGVGAMTINSVVKAHRASQVAPAPPDVVAPVDDVEAAEAALVDFQLEEALAATEHGVVTPVNMVDSEAAVKALQDELKEVGVDFDPSGIYATADAAKRRRLLAEARSQLEAQHNLDTKLRSRLALLASKVNGDDEDDE